MTEMGARELRTAEAVDDAGKNTSGVVMLGVNSVCGCAAGRARPGIALALRNEKRPDLVATVFAGADIEATEKARAYFTGYPPSSPSIALLKDGRNPAEICEILTEEFDAPADIIEQDVSRFLEGLLENEIVCRA